MKTSLRILLITYLAFALYWWVDDAFFGDVRTAIEGLTDQFGVAHILAYVIVGLPILLGLIWLHGWKGVSNAIGFNRSVRQGLGFALLCTLPMLIGYAVVFEWNRELDVDTILISVIAAGFFEEVYFRGFLFGQVFRFTKFGFIPAVLLGALLFAAVHLYQSEDPATLVGIFATTLLGGLLFAWVYAEWEYNIWVPIGLHMFMNLFWELFDVSDNAFGNTYANVFRILTIVLVIVLTVIYRKTKKKGFAVNRKTLWMQK